MRVLTCQPIRQHTRLLTVAAGVALGTCLLSGCGTRQDGSGGLPVLSLPRPGAAPRQTEPELSTAGAEAEPGDSGNALPRRSFPADADFETP